jgi:NitT/TauT family transport system ATP-binding protein
VTIIDGMAIAGRGSIGGDSYRSVVQRVPLVLLSALPEFKVLRLQAVGRRFDGRVEALRDVSLSIAAGEFVALLGPSGCGKSTLLRLIAGLDRPDAGTLCWKQAHAPGVGEIGFVFQDATLLPWASAEDNIYLPMRLRGVRRATAREAVLSALDRVGLGGFERLRPAQLSGGMRMRVSIARALVTRPRLLLMDEPFAALDEFTRHHLQADLHRLWTELGCTVVFVTHSIYEAAFLAQRIVLMTPRPGRIAAELASPLKLGPERRLDPAYTALVAEVTRRMESVLAA